MWKKQEEPKTSAPSTPVTAATPAPSKAESSTPAAPQSAAPSTQLVPVSAPAPNSAPSRPSTASAGHVSSTLVIKGEITGREDLFIDGDIQGKIRIDEGRVTIGSHGRVTADIIAREIVVQGNVKGNLHGRERVQIGQTGCARGNVLTRRISLDDGAEMHGNVEITQAEAQQSRASGAKSPAASAEAAGRTQESSTVA